MVVRAKMVVGSLTDRERVCLVPLETIFVPGATRHELCLRMKNNI
jgi:hypothetical protein